MHQVNDNNDLKLIVAKIQSKILTYTNFLQHSFYDRIFIRKTKLLPVNLKNAPFKKITIITFEIIGLKIKYIKNSLIAPNFTLDAGTTDK